MVRTLILVRTLIPKIFGSVLVVKMKKISLKLFLVGCLALFCFASFQVYAFQSFTVKNIRVRGLHRVSEAAVLNDLPVQEGQTLSEEGASEAIRALYQTGFFKDVSLSRDGDTLVVQVIERPSISKLTLEGVKEKDKVHKIVRDTGLAEGRMYDPTVVAKAVKALEKHYFGRGRYGVKIESNVTEESPGLVQVKLCIYEGDIAKIKQIKIIGNTQFKEKELLSEFHSSKTNLLSWFTNDDQYAKEKLNADLETLRSYYMDRGFLHFQVDSTQVSLTPDKKHIYITIYITEGDKYTFGITTLSGQFVFPKEEFYPYIEPLCEGSMFSRKNLLEVKQGLEDKMGDIGYAKAEANVNPSIDEANKVVNVNFDLVPGKRVYVRRIYFIGNANTKDEVLRREIPQMEGTWISTGLIKAGKENILRQGFGSNLEIETTPVAGTEDQVDITYKLEEARMGQVGAGLGYSATEKIMFNFNISQANFFGTGNMVEFTFDKSRSWSNYAFNYQDPYFTVDGVGFGAGAYYSKSDPSRASFVSDYIIDSLGAELRLAFPISKYEALSTSLGYDNTRLKVRPDDEADEIRDFITRYGKKFDEYIVGLGWGYNSLDQPIFPRRGLTQALKFRVTTPGSKLQYYKITYDACWFYPITESELWIFNLSSNLGYGNGYGKTPVMPFFRHFYAGGSRLVRGFEENSLGPKDSKFGIPGRAYGGNMLAAGTVSLIFPNPIKPDAKSIRTALFLDAGQVYDTHFRDKLLNGTSRPGYKSGLRYSVGISLAWHSPLGAPITFSLAKPINAKAGDEKRSFTFWMGTQF